MFVYNILSMEKPIKINIDNNTFFSNKKEIEQVNKILNKKNKEFNEKFFKEHCISDNPLKINGKLIVIPNPDIDDNWIKRFTDGWKELEHTPLVWEVPKINNNFSDKEIALSMAFKALDKKVSNHYSSDIEQSNILNNKKHILVITLPSNFLSILKILKTNKEQYFTLYKDKYSLKGKLFDAVVVNSSMPYYLEFYKSIKKHIRYNVPTYKKENETLKILK